MESPPAAFKRAVLKGRTSRSVQAMREPSHPETAAIELTRVLYALSDPVRLDVVRQLDREGEASCTALDRGRPKSSMSHHFRVLRRSEERRVGKECVRPGISRGSPYHETKKKEKH